MSNKLVSFTRMGTKGEQIVVTQLLYMKVQQHQKSSLFKATNPLYGISALMLLSITHFIIYVQHNKQNHITHTDMYTEFTKSAKMHDSERTYHILTQVGFIFQQF